MTNALSNKKITDRTVSISPKGKNKHYKWKNNLSQVSLIN